MDNKKNLISWSIKATPERIKELKKMKLIFLVISLVLLVVIIMVMIIIKAKDRFLGNSIFSGAIDDIASGLGAAAIIGLVITTLFLLQRFKEKDYILDEEGVLIVSKNKQIRYFWQDIRTYGWPLSGDTGGNFFIVLFFWLLIILRIKVNSDCYILLNLKPNARLKNLPLLRVPLGIKAEVEIFLNNKLAR